MNKTLNQALEPDQIRFTFGKAKKVRFKSKGRGLDSLEGKRTDTGLRFALQPPEEGIKGGWFGARTVCPPLSTGMTRW